MGRPGGIYLEGDRYYARLLVERKQRFAAADAEYKRRLAIREARRLEEQRLMGFTDAPFRGGTRRAKRILDAEPRQT